jgi:hypothetical protein
MTFHLEQDRLHIRNDSAWREYMIDDRRAHAVQLLQFCPWCGSKLPERLREEWFTLAEELSGKGEDFDLPTDEGLLPAGMFTDEWWIKRGL